MNELGRASWPENVPYEQNFEMLGVPYQEAGSTGPQETEQASLNAAEVQVDADLTPAVSPRPQLPREPGESQEDWETRVRFAKR